MRAVSSEQTWIHIFEEEEKLPEHEQTKFHLKVLDIEEEGFLDDNLGTMTDDGYSLKLGKQEILALDIGLANVENLMGDDGQPVMFERDVKLKQIRPKLHPWRRDHLSKIPKAKRRALARLIVDGPKLKEAERKN